MDSHKCSLAVAQYLFDTLDDQGVGGVRWKEVSQISTTIHQIQVCGVGHEIPRGYSPWFLLISRPVQIRRRRYLVGGSCTADNAWRKIGKIGFEARRGIS